MAGWLNRILRLKGPSQPPRTCAAEPVGPIFEPLEDRRLLAGDVVAIMKGSTLVLKGDSAANFVEISGDSTSLTLDSADPAPSPLSTTFNGVAAPAVFAGVTNIKIKLGGGNDYLDFDGLDLDGSVNIVSGNGVNETRVTDTTVGDDFKMKGKGSGNEYLRLFDNVTITDMLQFKGGKGGDRVSIDTTLVESGFDPVTVGRMNLNLGSGSNLVTIYGGSNSEFGKTKIKLSGTDSELDIGTFVPFDHDDDDMTPDIMGSTTFTNGLDIGGGSGDDIVSFDQVTVYGKTKFNGKDGNDELTVLNSYFDSNFKINTADGADTVSMDGSIIVGRADIKLGDDDDSVTFLESDLDNFNMILFAARIDGGDGVDEYDPGDFPLYITFPRITGFDDDLD